MIVQQKNGTLSSNLTLPIYTIKANSTNGSNGTVISKETDYKGFTISTASQTLPLVQYSYYYSTENTTTLRYLPTSGDTLQVVLDGPQSGGTGVTAASGKCVVIGYLI